MVQEALLRVINSCVLQMLRCALERNLLDDDLAKRVRQMHNLPYRQFQALMLTSDAFLGLSARHAADVMGISVGCVEKHLATLRTSYPCLARFEELWQSHDQPGSLVRPFDIDSVDERTITQFF